jgi:exportin-1
MTNAKINELKQSFNKEFSLIYELCEFILTKAQKVSLITSTLQTLLRFLNWIPLGYIFETQLIPLLTTKFFPVPSFRNDTLRCLTEIVSIQEEKYKQKITDLYLFMIQFLSKILQNASKTKNIFNFKDIPKAFKNGSNEDQQFIQILGLFLTSLFKNYQIENDAVIAGHFYLVEVCFLIFLPLKISKVDDTEVFKTCLEYWKYLSQELYFSSAKKNDLPLLLSKEDSRKKIYSQVLSQVRIVMISKMAKPEEVIIVEDENGDLVKETLKDVDSIQLYKTMRETLIYLTHLDYEDTETIMIQKLQAQVDGVDWSWNNLNTLCWAIGSIR